VHTLVLATTGRRTGTPRCACLIYGTSGGEYVVVASKGGADQDPDWFKNLLADPSAGVQVGTRRFTARARVASSASASPLAPDGAHPPAVRRVRAEDRLRDPDRPAHSQGLTRPAPLSCVLRQIVGRTVCPHGELGGRDQPGELSQIRPDLDCAARGPSAGACPQTIFTEKCACRRPHTSTVMSRSFPNSALPPRTRRYQWRRSAR
jgi:deazaflavin-dependent oxidoreductase (nitroreductase family)